MPAPAMAVVESDRSTAERYKSLIRIAELIRAQSDPQELFSVLVHELGQVLQFDGIARFDEASNKVDLYLCPGCRKPDDFPVEPDKEGNLAAWVYEHQQTLVLGTLDGETRFPASTRIMRQAGLHSVCAFPL